MADIVLAAPLPCPLPLPLPPSVATSNGAYLPQNRRHRERLHLLNMPSQPVVQKTPRYAVTGRSALPQAMMPPARDETFVNPCLINRLAAMLER